MSSEIEVQYNNRASRLHAACRCGVDEAVAIPPTSEFAGSGTIGDLSEAHVEIVKAGRSMIFRRGVVRTLGKPLMTLSGAMKPIAD